MRLAVLLLLLAPLAAAQCERNSWTVDDSRIAGAVSKEGKPVKHATVRLSSPDHEYTAVTDNDGSFLIWPVPVGKYSFAVKSWGEGEIQVNGRHRGGLNRPALLFSKHEKCLLLIEVSN